MLNSHEIFLKEINESFKLLDLKQSWDDEGAKPVSRIAYCKSLELLFTIIGSYGTIKPPAINACPDGSIDLDWGMDNGYRLLINVCDDKISYYGDNGFENDKINDEHGHYHNEKLFNWIKSHLIENQI